MIFKTFIPSQAEGSNIVTNVDMTATSLSTLNPSPSKIYRLNIAEENAFESCTGNICQRIWTLELLANQQTHAHALISNWTGTICADHWFELEHNGGIWSPCLSPDRTNFHLHRSEPVFLRLTFKLNAELKGVIYIWTKDLSQLGQDVTVDTSKVIRQLVR